LYIKKNLPPSGLLDEFEGVVQGHRDGHAFVLRDDGSSDVYLSHNEARAVLHKDRVKVRVIRMDRRGRAEGRVVEILDRPHHPIIGRLLHENGVTVVAPEDKRYGQDVLIPKNATGSAKVGQVVVVQLTEPPALFGQPVGRVLEVLGEMDDPGMEIEIAVRKYEVPHAFSAACLKATERLPDQVRPQDRRGRVDLTDVPLLTIDGEDARDFDDAVYCEPCKIGRKKGWRLLVAIADVSHYVSSGEAIDADAIERATSVYFPRRVIPMLPEKISNGLCSLNPNVDRLCMVCDMVVTADGQIHAYQFYSAVMHSHARLTYTEVAAVLSNTKGPEARRLSSRVDDLLHLYEVFQALLKARQQRGAIDLETTETQVICDDNGHILRIEPRTRNDAHRLIEETMLAANVCSADFILQHEHLGLFRVHEGPTPEKRETLLAYLRSLGVAASLSDDPKPSEFQAIAHATQGRADAQQIHTMLLRSMQQAIYTPVNSGHFGLAFEAYTHFTSPIRRYPDLLVHRVIKAIVGNKRYHLPALPVPGAAQQEWMRRLQKNRPPSKDVQDAQKNKKTQAINPELQAWQAVGLHCSANERRADEASKDVMAWLKCKFMRDHLGEEYTGVVSSVTSFGVFVTLDALYVEGLVHITELGAEYFQYDDVRQELRGERSGVRYAIGSRVHIQVGRVDLDARKIDFRMVRPGQDVSSTPAKRPKRDTDPKTNARSEHHTKPSVKPSAKGVRSKTDAVVLVDAKSGKKRSDVPQRSAPAAAKLAKVKRKKSNAKR
jgi:ribonuclease R